MISISFAEVIKTVNDTLGRIALAVADNEVEESQRRRAAAFTDSRLDNAMRKTVEGRFGYPPFLSCMLSVRYGTKLSEHVRSNTQLGQADALGFVAAIENSLPPRTVVQIPVNCFREPGIECLFCAPAEFVFKF